MFNQRPYDTLVFSLAEDLPVMSAEISTAPGINPFAEAASNVASILRDIDVQCEKRVLKSDISVMSDRHLISRPRDARNKSRVMCG